MRPYPKISMLINILRRKESLSLGARGEEAAKNYLKKLGYKIVALNFSNKSGRRLGEIDIIARDKNELVFVEVKTRMALNSSFSPLPEESITPAKLLKLNKAASFYLAKNNMQDVPYRFDAIAISVDATKLRATIRHIKNIFV
jgi:putative endonuclease